VQVHRLISPETGRLSAVYQAVDAVIVVGSLALITWLDPYQWMPHYAAAAGWAVGLFVFAAHFFNVYRAWRGSSMLRESARLIWAWLTVCLVLLFLAFSTKTSESYSRRIFLTWFVITPLLLIVWRGWLQILLGAVRRRGVNTRNVAIVGARELGVYLARTILDAPWMGLRAVGFYDDRKPSGTRPVAREPVELVGSLEALVNHAREGSIDIVYITLPMRAESRIHELIAKLSDTTASVYMVPDFFIFDLLHASWDNIGDLPVVSISETPFYGVDGFVKRLEDIMISGVLLLILAPVMLLIALGIKITSRGPAIFRQHRYGLRGNKIEVWKFRTMRVRENNGPIVQARKDDPRVTRFGSFLRRTSLDELPQLINVLRGSMSLVGPRPHAIAHNEQYRRLIDRYMLRHKVKPGITGLAQVNGWRGETDTLEKMQKRVEFDLAYIHNWSLWLDLKILFLTAFRVLADKNAY
jgi:putative colanic acid biosynthesis UDP-glucose lipid carrier transferase